MQQIIYSLSFCRVLAHPQKTKSVLFWGFETVDETRFLQKLLLKHILQVQGMNPGVTKQAILRGEGRKSPEDDPVESLKKAKLQGVG